MGEVTCWLLDTRKLWPGDQITTAKGGAEALSLTPGPLQVEIKRKMFIQDARMSLASALLQRLYVSRTLGIPWKDVRLGRKDDETAGKPCAVDADGHPVSHMDYNLSHQGGLVALIGFDGRNVDKKDSSGAFEDDSDRVKVGVDIVNVNERNDYRTIDQEGIDGWVDIYDFVFSDQERWDMKNEIDYITLPDGAVLTNDDLHHRYDTWTARHKQISFLTRTGRKYDFSSECIISAKLRRFYAYFCYKEAYIKLVGEALLAPWLKQLEFFNVRSPKPPSLIKSGENGSDGVWGELVEDVDIRLHRRPVDSVKMSIIAFEESYMLSTAIQGEIEGLAVPGFTLLDLEKDVLAFTPARQASK